MGTKLRHVLATALLAGTVVALPVAPAAPVGADTSGAPAGPGRAVVASLGTATGGAHSCAIFEGERLKCWGNNLNGELGLGDKKSRSTIATLGTNLPFVDLGGRRPIAVTAGSSHTCVIVQGGNVVCWGSGARGQLGYGDTAEQLVPPAASVNLGAGRTATAIAAGGDNTCAILDNGALTCWGRNIGGSLGDGTASQRNTPVPIALGPGRTATAVTTNGSHTCAILDNGGLTCWGQNGGGKLGYGDTSDRLAPPAQSVNLGVGRRAAAVTVHLENTCALLDNGSLKCWGSTNHGILGTGPGATEARVPPAATINVGTGRTVRAIAGSTLSVCALLDNNTVTCWGNGPNGQLGTGGNLLRTAPDGTVNLGIGRSASAIAGGGAHYCSVRDDLTLFCWGLTGGTGTGTPNPSLAQVGSARTVASLAIGNNFGCAMLSDGWMACWGEGFSGQLGDGVAESYPQPWATWRFSGGRTPVALSAGAAHVCAVLDDGSVRCWGFGENGRLGTGGTANATTPPNTGVPLGTGRTAKAISAGGSHTCVILDNNTVKCWGSGAGGKLGYGPAATSDRGDGPGEMGDNLPVVNLGAGRTAKAISAGGSHTCALLDNNTVKCWGNGASGRLGYGNLDTLFAPAANAVNLGTGRTAKAISAGFTHTCALLDNDTVKCWGSGAGGKLGNGGTGNVTAPPAAAVELGAGRTARSVSAGGGHTCAVLDNGSLKCWGANDWGQLGLGDQASRGDGPNEMGNNLPTVQLGTARTARDAHPGDQFSCALLDNQYAKCWGRGTVGQLGIDWFDMVIGDQSNQMGDNLPFIEFHGPPLKVVPQPSAFAALNPARLLDTRPSGQTADGQARGQGLRPARSVLELQVSGRAGVPAGAAAVVLNLTVTGGQAAGFVTAYPCGATRPNASNLNYAAGQTVANLAVVKVGAGGRVCLYNESATQLLADVTGFQPLHTGYAALNPARLLDTRGSGVTADGQFQRIGMRERQSTTTVQIAGRGGVPASAVAVVLNVTVSAPQANGFVTVYPCGTRPNASNLNYRAGQTVANLVVARLDAQGRVCLYTEAAAQLIADVAGAHPITDPLVALTPARLLDTRPSGNTVDGQGRFTAAQPAGSVTEVQITGRAGVPGNATTAIVNLTATGAQANGFVTAFPCGTSRPLTSSLNYRTGQTVPNLAIVKIGTGGRICLYTEATTHLLADITAAY